MYSGPKRSREVQREHCFLPLHQVHSSRWWKTNPTIPATQAWLSETVSQSLRWGTESSWTLTSFQRRSQRWSQHAFRAVVCVGSWTIVKISSKDVMTVVSVACLRVTTDFSHICMLSVKKLHAMGPSSAQMLEKTRRSCLKFTSKRDS